MTDADVVTLRDQLYSLAQVVVKEYEEKVRANRRDAQTFAGLAPDERIDVEERAAILEFDGKLSRSQAERLALSPYGPKLPKA